jgi:cobalt-zinc-cadmium efflux system membrane fusion protein
VIAETLELTGRVVPDAEHVRRLDARFPGAIREMRRSVGERVRAGETLAVIESNDSLQRYTLSAPIDGVVMERHANPGENTGSEPLYVIADHAWLWAELVLFPRELARVRTGQDVVLRAVDAEVQGSGRIVRIAPAEGESHGAPGGLYTARVAIDNSAGTWTPGLFLRGKVQIGEAQVPLAVRRSGLQAFRDFTVVFERIDDTFEVRMLELGRQDGTHVEVLGGLASGAEYVVENSYLIKADIDKSGASHDH